MSKKSHEPGDELRPQIQNSYASTGGMLAAQYQGIQFNYFYGASGSPSVTPPLIVPSRRVRTNHIRGRAELLAAQTALLHGATNESRANRPRVQVLYGLGGVGKTTVALEIAHRAVDRGTRVWWVRADDRTALVAALHTVAFEAGGTDEELTHSHPADVLWRRLNALETPWLLVLDNADDVEVLASAPDRLADGTGWIRQPLSPLGHILVTTRDGAPGRWSEWCDLHAVDVLTRKEAASVLLDRAPDAGDEEQAEALGDRLGGLPLALDIAGSYIAALGQSVWPDPELPNTFDRYRSALDEKFPDLIFDAGLGSEGARRTITSTWELSLDLLEERGYHLTRPLMRLLSCFGRAPIPYMAILEPSTMSRSPLFSNVNARALAESLGALAGMNLVTLTTTSLQRDDLGRTAELHPLVRDTNFKHSDISECLPAYLSLVGTLLVHAVASLTPESIGDRPRWAALAPHCAAAIPLLRRLPQSERAPVVSFTNPSFSAARYRRAAGLYIAAESELRNILTIRRNSLGESDPETLAVRHVLALTLRDGGQYRAAESELRNILTIRRNSLGESDPETLAVRHVLALTLRDEGQYRPAETELRSLLELSEGLLGSSHPQSIQARHSLASVMYALGLFDVAEQEYRAVLRLMSITYGPNHLSTLRTRHAIALALRDQNQYDGAESEFLAVLEHYRTELGEDHPQTSRARYNIATVHQAQGRLDTAEATYRSVLESQRGILGENHPYTLRTRYSLGVVLRDQGRLDAALEELQAVHAIQTLILGENHHYTLRTGYAVAVAIACREPIEAQAQLREIVSEQERSLGVEHPETRTTRKALDALRGEDS